METLMAQNKLDHLNYYPKRMKRNNIKLSITLKKKAELAHQ
jgi:hypothetical protein